MDVKCPIIYIKIFDSVAKVVIKLNMDKTYKYLYKKAKQIYKNEPTGHDFSHIKRCLKSAKKIQKAEGGDKNVIMIAVLFHDIHRVLSTKEKYVSAQESIPYVKKLLTEDENIHIEDGTLKKILYLIKEHDNKNFDANISTELIILQDADILDALGKIGLKRTKTYCINRKIPFYDGRYPLDVDDYIPDIRPYSTTHYVYRTMLPEMRFIKTETGKKLAKKQGRVLQKFIDKNCKKAGYTK